MDRAVDTKKALQPLPEQRAESALCSVQGTDVPVFEDPTPLYVVCLELPIHFCGLVKYAEPGVATAESE